MREQQQQLISHRASIFQDSMPFLSHVFCFYDTRKKTHYYQDSVFHVDDKQTRIISCAKYFVTCDPRTDCCMFSSGACREIACEAHQHRSSTFTAVQQVPVSMLSVACTYVHVAQYYDVVYSILICVVAVRCIRTSTQQYTGSILFSLHLRYCCKYKSITYEYKVFAVDAARFQTHYTKMDLFLSPNTTSSHFRPPIQKGSHFRLTIQYHIFSSPLYKNQVTSDPSHKNQDISDRQYSFQVISEPQDKNQVILDLRYNLKTFRTHHQKIKSFQTPHTYKFKSFQTPISNKNRVISRPTIQKPSHCQPTIQKSSNFRPPVQIQVMSGPYTKIKSFQNPMKKTSHFRPTIQFQVIADPPYNFKSFQNHDTNTKSFQTPDTNSSHFKLTIQK